MGQGLQQHVNGMEVRKSKEAFRRDGDGVAGTEGVVKRKAGAIS